MTLLSMRLQRTDDRKQKSSFGEIFFLWYLFSSKKSWLFWYDSSTGVQRNDFKNKIYNLETLFFWKQVFLQTTFLNEFFISGGTEDRYWNLKLLFQVFFCHRRILSRKKNIEWSGKIYQSGYTGKTIKKNIFQKKAFFKENPFGESLFEGHCYQGV